MCLRFLFLQVACIWVIKSTYTEVTSERVIVWGVDLVVANPLSVRAPSSRTYETLNSA